MMKKLKKMLSLLICLVMSLTTVLAATGCGPEEEAWDMSKVNLKVQVYDGGYGNDWLIACEQDFEEKYKDTSFGDLKGVDIHITTDRTLGSAIKTSYSILEQDMLFCPGVDDYYGLAKEGYLLDLTDIFTEVPAENQGTGKTNKTIAENLNADVENYLAVKDNQNQKHYYGLPCQGEGNGLNYDVDMFFNYGLYYVDGHTHSTASTNFITPIDYNAQEVIDNDGEYVNLVDGKYVTVLGDTLSVGPDGIYGTSDDGEPEYYSDFYNLCAYMKATYSINPCIWMSGAEAYVYSIANLLAKDYSGYDEAIACRDFSGTINYITSWNGDGTPSTFGSYDLDQDGADKAMVFKSAGYYYGVSFITKILNNNWYSSKVTGETSHIDAQYALLLSSARNTDNDNRVAFLLDGAYWEHEALQNGLFDSAVSKTSDDYFKYENRRFRILANPRVDPVDGVYPETLDTHRATVGGAGGTFAIILNKVSEDPQLEQVAKMFYQFVFSDVGNAYYTQYTSLCRSMDYTVDRDSLSYFGGQVYDLYHSDNTDIVCGLSTSEFTQEHISMLNSWYCISYKGSNYDRQILEPIMNQGCTARQYYEGLYNRQKIRLG